MAYWLKALALSLLWRRFDPWPRNFHNATRLAKKRERERDDVARHVSHVDPAGASHKTC